MSFDLDVAGFLCRNAKLKERARCLKVVEDEPAELDIADYPFIMWEGLTWEGQNEIVGWMNSTLERVKANIKKRIEEGIG